MENKTIYNEVNLSELLDLSDGGNTVYKTKRERFIEAQGLTKKTYSKKRKPKKKKK